MGGGASKAKKLDDSTPYPKGQEPDGFAGFCPCSGAPVMTKPIAMGMMMPMMRKMMNGMMHVGPPDVEPDFADVKDHEYKVWHEPGHNWDDYVKWRPYNLKEHTNKFPKTGEAAPDGKLLNISPGGAPSTLLAECKKLTDKKKTDVCAVLFCSITCPVGRLFANHDLYMAAKKKGIPVLCITTLEAHPFGEGGFHTPVNEKGAMAMTAQVPAHKTEEDRRKSAEGQRQVLKKQVKEEVHMWLDGMDDALEKAYEARPFRIYLINTKTNTIALANTAPCPLNVPAKVKAINNFKPGAPVAAPPASGKKGYVYGFFDLKNPEEFKTVYSPMAEPTLDPYGGKFIMKHALPPPMAAKMGMKESKGFGTTGQMAFMLEFASFEKAMGWFTGPEYAAVIQKRDEVADFKMAVVEGAPIQKGAGLVVGFFDLKDPKEFKEVYSPMAEPTLDPYSGKFAIKHALAPPMAAKMGMKETKTFGTTGQMAFVLQFPTFEKAMGWFTGPEYAAVTAKRDEVSDFRMAVVQAM